MKKQLLSISLLTAVFFCLSVFNVNGQAVDLPFSDDFESYSDTEGFLANSGWSTIDADGDGNNWYLHYDDFDDINVMASESYKGGALTPENYLITPLLNLPVLSEGNTIRLTYHVAATGSSYYEENYKVVVSTTGSGKEDFDSGDIVLEETLTSDESSWSFALRGIDLSSFAGQEVHIAFVHYDCTDQDRLIINTVMIEERDAEEDDLPFMEDFQRYEDTGEFMAESGWTMIDADGDGSNWFLTEDEGLKYMASESWDGGALEPENYLITPQIRLPEGAHNAHILLSYDIAATGMNFYQEKYKVVVSTTGNNEVDFTDVNIVFEETLTAEESAGKFAPRIIDLANYAGEAVYIAFVHYDCTDNDMLILNNVKVRQVNSAVVAPETAEFNVLDPEDISTTIFWYGASEVVKINDGTGDLTADTDYTVTEIDADKSTLTILADHLSGAEEGQIEFILHFDVGDNVVFAIDVTGTPENAVITPGMADFDPEDPDNVILAIAWGDATEIETVKVDGEDIDASLYEVAGDQLTIMQSFFDDTEPGYIIFNAAFDLGDDATFVVRIMDNTVMSLPFSEDFMGLTELGADTPEEWLPNGWRAVDNNNDGHNWYWVPVSVEGVFSYGRMQSRSAVQVDGTWEALTPDNWLITPPITLDQITAEDQSIELTFTVATGASTPGFKEENYSVMISYTDLDPDSFEELFSETLSQDHPQNELQERSVELSFYEGQTVYIAFRHHNVSDMDRILFSNVNIVMHGDPSSVQDAALKEINVYPNPARDYFTIEAPGNISRVELIGILGNTIYSQDVNNSQVVINVSDIPQGMYILRTFTDSGTSVRRVQVVR